MTIQKGFVPILVVILIAVVMLGGGYLAYQQTNKDSSTPPPNQVVCTQDAKLCPDGTSVGRTGPNCEFAACPNPESSPSAETASWKTYTNNNYSFRFNYPQDWKISTQIGTDNSSFFITLIAPNQRSQLGDNINIDVHDNRTNLSIDQYIRKIAGSDPYQYKTVEVNGLQAREYLDLPEASYVRRIYIKHESYIYEISIQSDVDEYLAIFDQILSTFRFIK